MRKKEKEKEKEKESINGNGQTALIEQYWSLNILIFKTLKRNNCHFYFGLSIFFSFVWILIENSHR